MMSLQPPAFGFTGGWNDVLADAQMAAAERGHWELLENTGIGSAWWAEWDRLCKSVPASHPGLDSTFVSLLARRFAPRGLMFATLRMHGAAIAKTLVHPLPGGAWTQFCPAQVVVAPMVYDADAMRHPRLMRDLLRSLGARAWKLDLPYQDERVSLLGTADAARTRVTGGWQTVSIAAPEGYDAYWASRSRDLRHNIERRLRKAEREGLQLSMHAIRDPVAIGAAVDRFCQLESSGWKGRAGTALRCDNTQGRFYRDVMIQMARQGAATAYELHAGSRLIASRLVISGGDRHAVLKTTFDEALDKLSPGFLLLHLMLRQLLADPKAVVELCTHASAQQLQWATDVPQMKNLSVYRLGLVRRAFDLRARWRAHSDGSASH
jgi:hypothetical protein